MEWIFHVPLSLQMQQRLNLFESAISIVQVKFFIDVLLYSIIDYTLSYNICVLQVFYLIYQLLAYFYTIIELGRVMLDLIFLVL